MHFTNARNEKVTLVPGCMICRDDVTGTVLFFLENGMRVEFHKDRNSDPMLAGHVDDLAVFRNRALIAARLFGLNIEPFSTGEKAFKFV